MNRPKPVIGLVGGIGAGKSAVAEVLAERGGRIVAGDPAGHAALLDPDVRARVASRWPEAISKDGAIDRKTLGRIVFADPVQLKELEAIVFPWIEDRLRREIAAAEADPSVRFVVLDAAIMLEAGWQRVCDKLVFVDVPRELRVARVALRGWTPEDLDRRERTQMALSEKQARADAVLTNTAGMYELQKNVDALLAHWGLAAQPT
ncbi:MAG: dephospho-CoA kinase [Gemmataceae bacterium]